MMKKKLLFLRKFNAKDMSFLKQGLSDHYDFIIPKEYTDKEMVALSGEAEVFLGRKLFKELVDNAKNLKVIQSEGAGVDNIDLGILKNTKIALCNSHSSSCYVAEYAVALMFSLLKKIPLHDRYMRDGKWFRPSGSDEDSIFESDSLIGKNIGLLGYGNIGKKISGYLSGFDVNIRACSRRSVSVREDNVTFCELDDILSVSDIIFIAMPLTAETEGLLTHDKLRQMKRTAFLINVSRAEIIEQGALYEILLKREIAGAALDVWYGDRMVRGGKTFPSSRFSFHELDNLVMSPYRAGYIRDGASHLEDVVKNLVLYAKEGKYFNVVDIERGY